MQGLLSVYPNKLCLLKTKLFFLLSRLLSLSPGLLEGLIFVECALCVNKPLPEVFGMSSIKGFTLIYFSIVFFPSLSVIMSPYRHYIKDIYGFDRIR